MMNISPLLDEPKAAVRYKTFNRFLREHFQARVYRVPLDAGFTCPNRDGSRAFGGCTFCDERGSGAPTINLALSIKQQLESGIERIRRRFKANKFLAYFQAFTNTYAPEGVLRTIYDVALDNSDVVGLCIGTRPDCLSDNIIDLIAEYNEKTFVWLEVGLQSAKNHTLQLINRGHTAEEFFDAVDRGKKRNLRMATHLIFGLPEETEEDMLQSIRQVAASGMDAVKIHQLCIYKGTPMEEDFKCGRLGVLEEDDYVRLVADSIELLHPEQIIMRLVAEGQRDEIIAPEWAFDKHRVMAKIEGELTRRDTFQGRKFSPLQ